MSSLSANSSDWKNNTRRIETSTYSRVIHKTSTAHGHIVHHNGFLFYCCLQTNQCSSPWASILCVYPDFRVTFSFRYEDLQNVTPGPVGVGYPIPDPSCCAVMSSSLANGMEGGFAPPLTRMPPRLVAKDCWPSPGLSSSLSLGPGPIPGPIPHLDQGRDRGQDQAWRNGRQCMIYYVITQSCTFLTVQVHQSPSGYGMMGAEGSEGGL